MKGRERVTDKITLELAKLFMEGGIKAMVGVAETMEALVKEGEEIPPELHEALQLSCDVAKKATDKILPTDQPDVKT